MHHLPVYIMVSENQKLTGSMEINQSYGHFPNPTPIPIMVTKYAIFIMLLTQEDYYFSMVALIH